MIPCETWFVNGEKYMRGKNVKYIMLQVILAALTILLVVKLVYTLHLFHELLLMLAG